MATSSPLNPSSADRVRRQRHRLREPDCPRRPAFQAFRCSAPDRCPERSASSDPPANRVGIIPRESLPAARFHTARVKRFIEKRIVHGHVVAFFSDYFASVRIEDETNPLPVTPHQGSDHLGLLVDDLDRLPAERERRVIRERAANSAARVACASFIIFVACIRFGAPFVSARGF